MEKAPEAPRGLRPTQSNNESETVYTRPRHGSGLFPCTPATVARAGSGAWPCDIPCL